MEKLKIRAVDDPHKVAAIRKQLRENGGYCPCRLVKNDDTKCICKEFRDQIAQGISGECHCGLYKAIKQIYNVYNYRQTLTLCLQL